MRTVTVAATALLLWMGSAKAAPPSADVMALCDDVRGGVVAANPYKLGKCAGYLRGFAAAANLVRRQGQPFAVCVPENTPDIDLIAAYNAWADGNRKKGNEPDWFSLYNALHTAYPCPAGR